MVDTVKDFFKKNLGGLNKPWDSGDKYSAKDNFPELSKHNNVMAGQLTLEVSVTFLVTSVW